VSVVDPGAKISAVRELHPRFRTPPSPLKGRKVGGFGIVFIAVDLGALIWAVGDVHPRFRTPPGLKVERQKGSGIQYASFIWVRKSGPLGLARDLS
jgi:hypothetical protein